MAAFDFDLFVIGGGSGGVRAARVAAQRGARVGLAEESRYGGTCVIRGCVPKKLMVYASGFSREIRESLGYGWDARADGFDWTAFRKRLDGELDRLEGVYRGLLSSNGVETFDARARLGDAHTVELSTGGRRTAKHILVATGGRPAIPEIPGAECAIASDGVFQLDALPESALVVGGGYIACEFACILNGLGVATTQFHRGEQILRGFDGDARSLVSEEMVRSGVDLRLNATVESISREAGGLRVRANDGAESLHGMVLIATGRVPNTEGLGLEEAGAALGPRGEVRVDRYSQTPVPSIYAIGDATDRVNLTPVAISEAMAFVETVFGGVPTPVDHALIPTAVFTHPELGTVGLSEEEAREGSAVDVHRASFRPMRQAFADGGDRVLMKLVVCRSSRRVLGCHIVAPGAAEMIQLAGIAVKMGATKEDFDRTMAVHPTMAEELVTMGPPE